VSRPEEIELKLELDPGGVEHLKASPALAGPGKLIRHRLRSVYFDTPKHLLAKAGLTLRVRTQGGRHVQTIKSANGAAAGLSKRHEWEGEIAGPQPDLTAAEGTPLAALVHRRAVRKNLKPVFETSVARAVRRVVRDGAEIEVAIDEGEVRAGTRRAPVLELELELKRGAPQALFALAAECNRSVSIRLGVESKAERGFALLRGGTAKVAKAEPIDLAPDMTVGDSFRAIASACIRHFRLNEAALVERRRAESLHQVRVAVRRLRSALSLYNAVVADPALAGLKARLQHVSRQLGEARNIDVFLAESIAGEVKRPDTPPGAASFAARARQGREVAYDRVIATLTAEDFRGLMLDLAGWIDHGAWTRDPALQTKRDMPLADFAAMVLDAWRRKVKKKGKRLAELDEAQRHRVRIAAKKLRYATEFFASVYDHPKARRRHDAFLDSLEQLQSRLGELNDIASAQHLAEVLSRQASEAGIEPTDGEAEAFAAGFIAGENDRHVAPLVEGATKAYARFAEAKPFWR
jgi:triphosphatase